MAKKYIKSHSNYITKTNPSASKIGYIYENDLPTTLQKYNNVDGTMTTATDGGFIFVVNTTTDSNQVYNTDGWSNNTFTLNNIPITNNDFINFDNKLTIRKQKYVKLNKEYNDLSDYCYFGSSNAMLKASIDNIITKFPAAIYVNSTGNVITSNNVMTIPNNSIENKFFINLFNYYPSERVNLSYSLRVMASSYIDYEVTLEDDTYVGDVIGFTGYTDSDSNIYIQLSTISATGPTLLIKPKKKQRDMFFDNLDDFESLLLNQYSVPKYKSNFKIPKAGDNGVEYENKSFIWTTTDGYNIDIQSTDYSIFITDLIDATNLIDELYCDNLYRMLTHDTIKNLDSTYNRNINNDDLNDIIIGGTKIQKVLRLYGRSFDEIKSYIEGISFVNTITYDKKNNLPFEYLDGKLNMSGWDVFSLSDTIGDTTTLPNIFLNSTKSYNVKEIDYEIMRRLILNSKHIFRSKGTKKSIRKILGLLGVNNEWYEINEYIQNVDNYITGETLENIARLNYNINSAQSSITDGGDEYKYEYNETLFNNTNIGIKIICPICGSSDYIISSNNGGSNLLIGTTSGLTINESGWLGYEISENLINGESYIFTGEFHADNGTGGGYMLTDENYINSIPLEIGVPFTYPYSSTRHYLKIVNNYGGGEVSLINAKLEKGNVSTPWSPNVLDVEDDSSYGMCVPNKHIFLLTDGMVGYPKPITNSSSYYFQQKGNWYRETGGSHVDSSGNTYVNNLTFGNNPHIGNGEFDNGYDYIDQFSNIFKSYIRNSNLGTEISGYTNVGFQLTTKKDNNNKIINENSDLILNLKNFVIGFNGDKILQSFFYNNNSVQKLSNEGNHIISTNDLEYIIVSDTTGSTYIVSDSIELETFKIFKIHNDINGNGQTIYGDFGLKIEPGETVLLTCLGGENYTCVKYNGIDEFNILKSITLPYLEQIIPSTTIFDFVLIDNQTPKWLLVDKYCEKDDLGNLTGYQIIVYQNINYYDNVTVDINQDLIEKIVKDFGSGFTYFNKTSKNGNYYFELEDGNGGMLMENGNDSITNNESGFDNLYYFKRQSSECGLNTDAIWVIDSEIINT